jgi:shikimate kinase
MGLGKSTVSAMLSEALDLSLVDTDALALSLSGKKSIAEIFQYEGETVFRELELKVAQSLKETDNVIVATGGGMVMNQLSMDALRHNGQVIYLKTSLEKVLERIGNDEGRPLLQDKLQLSKLYEMRSALYNYYGNWTVETDARSPEDITQLIHLQLSKINNRTPASLHLA